MPRESDGCIRLGSWAAKLCYEAIELLEGINIFAANVIITERFGFQQRRFKYSSGTSPSPLLPPESALKMYRA